MRATPRAIPTKAIAVRITTINKVKFITLATSSVINPTQGDISVAYEDTTLDKVKFHIRWYGLSAGYVGVWLTLGV